jgi:hypothetical protein
MVASKKSRRLFDHASELAHQSTLLVDKQRRVFRHVHRQNGRDLHLRIRISFGHKSNLEAKKPGNKPKVSKQDFLDS